MTLTPKRVLPIAGVLFAAAILCVMYGYFIEPSRLVVNRSVIKNKDWDPAFDGFRIVMIGDIHGGSNNVTEEKLKEVVALANDQNADIIVMLGDYVSPTESGIAMPVATMADNLAGLRARYGVYAVLGNHDGGYGDSSVAAELTRVGCRVLQNEVAIIENSGARLRILGLKDHLKLGPSWYHTSSQLKPIVEASGEGNLIVLEHSPDVVEIITGGLSISKDLRLILAAHTHGGQIRFPILGRPVVPSNYGQKYAYGHVKENGVDTFVTSGIGTSIMPFRFMVPPEIVVLTMQSE